MTILRMMVGVMALGLALAGPGVGVAGAAELQVSSAGAVRAIVTELSEALKELRERIQFCSICFNITEHSPCPICESDERDRSVICVVEEPLDVMAIERTREYHGLYHVLHGALSPLRGIGPEQLKIKNLIERIGAGQIEEMILATNPTAEGEATAVYLSKLIKPLGVRVTRIAMGIPVGSDLEFADEVTIWKAMEGRREM